MLLVEPQPTNFDLRFSVFGFPVRIHPLFFVMPLVLAGPLIQGFGEQPGGNAGIALLVVEVVFLISILIHELGHAFAFRYYGISCHIVLYWLGGLAIPDSVGGWSRVGSRSSYTPMSQIVISAAGPVFGLITAGLLVGLVYLMGGRISLFMDAIFPLLIPDFSESSHADNLAIWLFFWTALWANVFWNILNLFPIFPLDGGQIARQIFIVKDPWNGVRNSLMLSMIAAIVVAILGLVQRQTFMTIFFGFLAWQSYSMLQQSGGGGFGGRPWR